MLAKASSIVGAASPASRSVSLLFLLTRPVSPSVGSLGAIIATAVCGALAGRRRGCTRSTCARSGRTMMTNSPEATTPDSSTHDH